MHDYVIIPLFSYTLKILGNLGMRVRPEHTEFLLILGLELGPPPPLPHYTYLLEHQPVHDIARDQESIIVLMCVNPLEIRFN